MATLSAISAKAGYCKAPTTLSWKVNTEMIVASTFVSFLFFCACFYYMFTSLTAQAVFWLVGGHYNQFVWFVAKFLANLNL